ncbi:DUF6691 family protein [Phaeobacter sp.]|uniref:DUF6691 family protein n=1 Tax=Phaeobacter sp. TaxID=1902409 RepID=UPI0025E9C72E|nr:DUF6691 family protein [Phaeobacter sp.]
MKRFGIAFVSGALFGAGLLISGMTDTQKVQGFLDITGSWDPTLAFVMVGAILPMMLAWRLTRGRRPLAGGQWPAHPKSAPDRRLIVGSTMFGVGWGLAGLCPGPAIASVGFGGTEGLLFLAAMAIGMIGSGRVLQWLDQDTATA